MPGWFSRQTEYAIPGVLLAVIIAMLVLPPIWFLVQGSLYRPTPISPGAS